MIIFGWGHGTKKNYGATLAITCPNCKNKTWLQLSRNRKWFTLFFIPVIPYSTKHLLCCDVCSHGVILNGEKVQKAKQLNELTKKFFNEEIAKDKYWNEADKIKLLA